MGKKTYLYLQRFIEERITHEQPHSKRTRLVSSTDGGRKLQGTKKESRTKTQGAVQT